MSREESQGGKGVSLGSFCFYGGRGRNEFLLIPQAQEREEGKTYHCHLQVRQNQGHQARDRVEATLPAATLFSSGKKQAVCIVSLKSNFVPAHDLRQRIN